MFVEAISCLPHPPTPDLYRQSLLSQLLLHPLAHQSSDYVTIATVNRRYDSSDNTLATKKATEKHKYKYNAYELSSMIQSTLQALRLIAQLSGIY